MVHRFPFLWCSVLFRKTLSFCWKTLVEQKEIDQNAAETERMHRTNYKPSVSMRPEVLDLVIAKTKAVTA